MKGLAELVGHHRRKNAIQFNERVIDREKPIKFIQNYCRQFDISPPPFDNLSLYLTSEEEMLGHYYDAAARHVAHNPDLASRIDLYNHRLQREGLLISGMCLPVSDGEFDVYINRDFPYLATWYQPILEHELVHWINAGEYPNSGFNIVYRKGENLNEAVTDILQIYATQRGVKKWLGGDEYIYNGILSQNIPCSYPLETLLLLDLLQQLQNIPVHQSVSWIAQLAASKQIPTTQKINKLYQYVCSNISPTFPAYKQDAIWTGLLEDFSDLDSLYDTLGYSELTSFSF